MHKYYSAVKRKESVIYTVTWMNLEKAFLSESQTQKNKYDSIYVRYLKYANLSRQKVE